jgi:putative transposase
LRPEPIDLPAGTITRRLSSNGGSTPDGVTYTVDGKYCFQHVMIVTDDNKITVADLNGEILIEHTRPAPGIKYVGNGRPRGGRPRTPYVSPES